MNLALLGSAESVDPFEWWYAQGAPKMDHVQALVFDETTTQWMVVHVALDGSGDPYYVVYGQLRHDWPSTWRWWPLPPAKPLG